MIRNNLKSPVALVSHVLGACILALVTRATAECVELRKINRQVLFEFQGFALPRSSALDILSVARRVSPTRRFTRSFALDSTPPRPS